VPVVLPRTLPEGTLLFSAGLSGKPYVSKGGRVVNAVGLGATVAEAVRRAYTLVDAVKFEGALVRRDIGAGL
jgi:phosphoribosylamine--glycine ligase